LFLVGFACCADRCGSFCDRLELVYLEKQYRGMQILDSVRWSAVARCIVWIAVYWYGCFIAAQSAINGRNEQGTCVLPDRYLLSCHNVGRSFRRYRSRKFLCASSDAMISSAFIAYWGFFTKSQVVSYAVVNYLGCFTYSSPVDVNVIMFSMSVIVSVDINRYVEVLLWRSCSFPDRSNPPNDDFDTSAARRRLISYLQ
jgi:hypothetical protein